MFLNTGQLCTLFSGCFLDVHRNVILSVSNKNIFVQFANSPEGFQHALLARLDHLQKHFGISLSFDVPVLFVQFILMLH